MIRWLLALLLFGCTHVPDGGDRARLARDIAVTAGLTSTFLEAGRFSIQARYKLKNPAAPVTVYIEGDGHVWTRVAPSADPTPVNPVALRLAALDASENILYLARPCHYSLSNCTVQDWTSARMSGEVVEAYLDILRRFQEEQGVSRYRLVGFSGGGGVAVLLAAHLHRDGLVDDLRTVAGNLDHQLWTRRLGLLPLSDSLNPRDNSAELVDLPQLHFVGAKDQIIDSSIYDNYAAAASTNRCLKRVLVPVAHATGWARYWPDLSREPITCKPLAKQKQ